MRVNWQHLIFAIVMISVWAVVMFSFLKIASDHKEDRQENLRENFSPMSENPEIQEAYDAIRNK